MGKRNDPARKGEAVECLLAGDIHGHTATRLRAQFLNTRFGLSVPRALLLSALAWEARP